MLPIYLRAIIHGLLNTFFIPGIDSMRITEMNKKKSPYKEQKLDHITFSTKSSNGIKTPCIRILLFLFQRCNAHSSYRYIYIFFYNAYSIFMYPKPVFLNHFRFRNYFDWTLRYFKSKKKIKIFCKLEKC